MAESIISKSAMVKCLYDIRIIRNIFSYTSLVGAPVYNCNSDSNTIYWYYIFQSTCMLLLLFVFFLLWYLILVEYLPWFGANHLWIIRTLCRVPPVTAKQGGRRWLRYSSHLVASIFSCIASESSDDYNMNISQICFTCSFPLPPYLNRYHHPLQHKEEIGFEFFLLIPQSIKGSFLTWKFPGVVRQKANH